MLRYAFLIHYEGCVVPLPPTLPAGLPAGLPIITMHSTSCVVTDQAEKNI